MKATQNYGFLVGISVDAEGKRFPLEGEQVLIGRGTACQVQLKDPKVSRQHARILLRGGATVIEDMESSHGTLVNGQRMASAELMHGDEITLGDVVLRFESHPGAAATRMAGASAVVPGLICPSCGEKVKESENFCSNCGHSLKELAQPSPVVAPPVEQPKPIVSPPQPAPQPTPIPQPATGREVDRRSSQRQWRLFVLGLAVPLLLGTAAIVALMLLGVFNLPDPPMFNLSQSASTSPMPEVASTDDEASTTDDNESPILDQEQFVLRAFDPVSDAGLPTQGDLSDYYDVGDESQYSYSIPLYVGQEVILDNFYCGTTEDLLENISPAIDIIYEIDGMRVPADGQHVEKLTMDKRACYVYRTVFKGLQEGEYILVQTMSVSEQIFDGWETWGPEDLVTQYLIRVGN
jgi:hypothetical protein